MAKKNENQTVATKASVTDFINSVEDEAQRADSKKALKLMKEATGEKAVMWGPAIIGFGSYHYVYESGREGDAPLVGFSPRKGKMTFYVMAGSGLLDTLLEKLGKHKMSKGCLYITKLSDVDEKVLSQIVRTAYQGMKKKYPSK